MCLRVGISALRRVQKALDHWLSHAAGWPPPAEPDVEKQDPSDGICSGPHNLGLLSELYRRKTPLIFAIFQIPVAGAQNLQIIMLCRFFGGFFGSAPLSIVGGTLTDFWGLIDRGIMMTIFAGATFIELVAESIVGGFVVQVISAGAGRNTSLLLSRSYFFSALGFISVLESYGPTLLSSVQRRCLVESPSRRCDCGEYVYKIDIWGGVSNVCHGNLS
ncbi:hypothetical protein K469DRAFT_749156 [Zopfia rhizophila CBS 207.26]|uniref:Major facilitator superfamily (MFS) profile domain-containing protein n=1 Tax=Zopfia rhizophila CBS 207.26 TaxID=1314779 RepID=A0A6A6E8B2_9PEZI|nr:hypothetical protein K469DRAFT_749156 [Zopfia rhizophila CBS 207.26]